MIIKARRRTHRHFAEMILLMAGPQEAAAMMTSMDGRTSWRNEMAARTENEPMLAPAIKS